MDSYMQELKRTCTICWISSTTTTRKMARHRGLYTTKVTLHPVFGNTRLDHNLIHTMRGQLWSIICRPAGRTFPTSTTGTQQTLQNLHWHVRFEISWFNVGLGLRQPREVHLSMLDYVTEALVRFQHEKPTKPQHQPYLRIEPKYTAKNNSLW